MTIHAPETPCEPMDDPEARAAALRELAGPVRGPRAVAAHRTETAGENPHHARTAPSTQDPVDERPAGDLRR